MWNNFRSDIYRALHTKSFYVILAIIVALYCMMLGDYGVQNSTYFAQFTRGEHSFIEYLYYIPKSMLFPFLSFLFIGLFSVEEYVSGFIKNTYSISTNKIKLIAEKYLFCITIIVLYYLAILVASILMQLLNPTELGAFEFFDYMPYLLVQIVILAAGASFMMILVHLTRSKVIVVLFSLGYGMFIYAMAYSLLEFMFEGGALLEYTLYYIGGNLPYTFSVDTYTLPILTCLGCTILYSGVNYFILKKKDL